MTRPVRNLSASVEKRLLNRARQTGEDFQYVLMRYALERMMYRLSQSIHSNQFIVKGALLLTVWTGEQYRPTKDLDLLALHEESAEQLKRIFRDLSALTVEDDGLVFIADMVRVGEIREDNVYGGIRVSMQARLGKIRIPLQIDIGFGDAVTPRAQHGEFPTLLDLPAPYLLMYPRETAIAEKYETMVNLGLANSRMKDYFDIWLLSQRFDFDGELLKNAIQATFRRRRTELIKQTPLGLSIEFFSDLTRQSQWQAFIRRSRLSSTNLTLESVVKIIAGFITPASVAAAESRSFRQTWPSGGPWQPM